MDFSELDWSVNRRDALLLIVGWFVGVFLQPFKRPLAKVLLTTPFGRRPRLEFAYGSLADTEKKIYRVQITNTGGETAQDVAINFGFEERIVNATALEASNMPPSPDIYIQSSDFGKAQAKIDRVRREFDGEQIPYMIHFEVEQGSSSQVASQLPEEGVMQVGYSYYWDFLGERFYESDTIVISAE